jgi:hypothetical protein
MTETDETERGRGQNDPEEPWPDALEYPATETVQLALNGRLTVTLVALNLSLNPHRGVTPPEDDPDNPSPFVPYRAKRSLTGAQSGDIGLGKPALQAVVTGTVDRTGDEVIFGRSVGTALEPFRSPYPGQPGMLEAMMCTPSELCDAMRDSDDEIQIYQGPAAYCLSLWSTLSPGITVLAIEQLDAAPHTLPVTVEHSPADIADLAGHLVGLKSGSATLEGLGLLHFCDAAREPLHRLITHSGESVRGDRLARALTIVVGAGMQNEVDAFLDITDGTNFDVTELQQKTGYVPDPKRLDLVEEPSVTGTFSAASSDGRLILLNLDSMSVMHDFLGTLSENLVAATFPVLGDMAATEATMDRLNRAMGSHGHPESLANQLELLGKVRSRQALRLSRRATAGQEQAKRWSNAGHLASHLDRAYAGQRDHIEDVTSRCADVVRSAGDAHHQRRESWKSGQAGRLAFGAFLVGLIAMFAALVGVSSGEDWDWVSEVGPEITFMVAAVVASLLLFPLLSRPKE